MSGSLYERGVAIREAQPADMNLDKVRERMQPHAQRVAELLRRYPVKRAALLQVLWLVQEEFNWVPRIAIKWAAEVCEVSPVHAFSVVEFYTMYQQVPQARYHIRVCHNVSCHIQGAEDLIAHLEAKLGIHSGEHSEDGLFALDRVECLAACGNGPAVQINDDFLFGPGELNEHQIGWHPRAEDLDAWIDRLRERATKDPQWEQVDQLGGIILESAGHPGAPQASAQSLPKDYAPPPPALKVTATSQGEAISVNCRCAPEVTIAICERSDDNGAQWREVAQIDPRSIKGPPGPKSVSFDDTLPIGTSANYRVLAISGERQAAPSATCEVTAVEAQAETGGDA